MRRGAYLEASKQKAVRNAESSDQEAAWDFYSAFFHSLKNVSNVFRRLQTFGPEPVGSNVIDDWCFSKKVNITDRQSAGGEIPSVHSKIAAYNP